MKLFILAFCLGVAGCNSVKKEMTASSPSGILFAEIRLTQGAFHGPTKGKSGFFFYIEENDGFAGPRLTGYRYKTDVLERIFGGDSSSADTVRALRAVGLEPFDFDAEVKLCEARIQEAANARGEQMMTPFVLDGEEFEIVIVTDNGRFSLRRWNPGVSINYYAAHSPKIAKLKTVLDILAQNHGYLEFGI